MQGLLTNVTAIIVQTQTKRDLLQSSTEQVDDVSLNVKPSLPQSVNRAVLIYNLFYSQGSAVDGKQPSLEFSSCHYIVSIVLSVDAEETWVSPTILTFFKLM